MATQNANVERKQPYNHPAYDKPRRVAADNRRRREQVNRRTDRARSASYDSSRPTTDQIFSTQYNEPDQRPGATSGTPDQTRNVSATYQTNSGPVRSAKSTDEIFSEGYKQAGLQPANDNKAPDQTSKTNVIYNNPKQVPVRGPWGSTKQASRFERASYKTGKKAAKPIKYLAARVRVTTANVWIGSWAMFWYLTFQLPLAAISAAGLGMAYAVYISIMETAAGRFILSIIEDFVRSTASYSEAVLAWAFKLFGINFDPILLFITPFALVFLLGLFQLILTWFVYTVMRINSLSGKAGGLKGLMFVLAGVGYAIPILNMFPLIFLWMAVVWIYPK